MIYVILALAPQVVGGITACEPNSYWRKSRAIPLSQEVSLELTTDRREYVVGEAIEFTVSLKNVSPRRLDGSFRIIRPAGSLVRIDYQRDDEPVRALDRGTVDPHALVATRGALEAEASVAGSNVRAVDGARDALVLDKPGSYRFKATFCEQGGDLNTLVVSNDARVDVGPVPRGQEAAWGAYTGDIAAIGERFSFLRKVDTSALNQAFDFVERFPDSPWSSLVRRRLLGFAPAQDAPAAAKDRFERLREAARERGEKRFNGREP